MEKSPTRRSQAYPTIEDIELSGASRERLLEILSESKILDARVWLDGVHTSLSRLEQVQDGHEVYFKIEGKIDAKNGEEEENR
jgi:hypothetical protein